ncbi:MAG: GEVED domain-containing protein, partial [Flavobacteriales bacterium]
MKQVYYIKSKKIASIKQIAVIILFLLSHESFTQYCPITSATCSGANGRINQFQIREGNASGPIIFNNNNSAACPNPSYYDFTSLTPPTLTIGQTYTFQTSVQTSFSFAYGVRIWIDYNEDFVFDNTNPNIELVGITATTAANPKNVTLTIPVVTPGIKRLRVRSQYNSNVMNPCGSATSGTQTHDYLVNIVSSCTAPTVSSSALNFTPGITNINATSWTRGNGDGGVLVVARLNTTAAVAPTSGDNYTANANFGSGSSTGAGNFVVYNGNAANPSVNITGLNPGADYRLDFYEYNSAGICYQNSPYSVLVSTLNCTAPSGPSSMNFSGLTNSSITVNYIRGGGQQIIVLARQGSAVNAHPVSGNSYTAGPFGSGSQIGTNNWVVYIGTANSFTLTGLTLNTNYHFAAYEFNNGPPTCYNITNVATGNATTTNVMNYVSSTTVQNNATINPNSTNQWITRLEVITSGATSPLSVTNITFNTAGTTNPALDLSSARIYYTTNTTFATTTPFGALVSNPDGTYNITGNQVLTNGTNYFWLAYNLPAAATLGNTVSGAITSFSIGANNTFPDNMNSGNRLIELAYCAVSGTYSGSNARITNVTITRVANSQQVLNHSDGTLQGGYQNFTQTVQPIPLIAGEQYTFSISRTLDIASAYGIRAWIDYNNDGTFNNTNPNTELLFILGQNTAGTLTATYTVPNIGPIQPGTYRMRIRNLFNTNNFSPCGHTNFSEAEDYLVTIIDPGPMYYVSSTTTQNTSDINPNSVNQQIIGLRIVTDGTANPLNISSISFNTNGTNNPLNNLQSAKIFFTGNTATFSAINQFGSTINNPSGTHTINGNQTLLPGNNYFWIAYDLKPSATIGDYVDAECTSFTLDNIPYSPSITAPAGARQINLVFCTPVANNCYLFDFFTSTGQNYGYISNVSITTGNLLNNTSAPPSNCGNTNQGYSDYTNLSAPLLQAGGSYDFSVTRGSDGFTNYFFAVWIDLNLDGQFNNTDYHPVTNPTGERFINLAASTAANLNFSITIPANIPAGIHRIRLRNIRNNSSVSPCAAADYGEAEDYRFEIPMTTIEWTGAVNTNWSLQGNWNPQQVPPANSDVLIPNTLNKPVISGISPVVNTITLNAGATLTINPNGALTVNGVLTNNGTITVQSGGALVQGTSSTTAGTGTYNIRRHFPGASNNGYRYVGSPIADIAANGISGIPADGPDGAQIIPLAGCSPTAVAPNSPNGRILELRENPATVIAGCAQSLWHVKSAGTLENGRGYAMRVWGGTTATFSGAQINNGNVTFAGLTRQADSLVDHLQGGIT